jgi:hypothetical protein
MATAGSTIRVSGLRRQAIASLKSQAAQQGLSLQDYVKELIETDMSIAAMARSKSIDEVFAPVQRQFRESAMTEDELDRLVDTARTAHHNQVTKRKKR